MAEERDTGVVLLNWTSRMLRFGMLAIWDDAWWGSSSYEDAILVGGRSSGLLKRFKVVAKYAKVDHAASLATARASCTRGNCELEQSVERKDGSVWLREETRRQRGRQAPARDVARGLLSAMLGPVTLNQSGARGIPAPKRAGPGGWALI